MVGRVAYWFIFWIIWLNWYILIGLLAGGSELSVNEWLDLIKFLLSTGGVGAIGGILYQSLILTNSQHSQKRHCCYPTIFWGLFWIVVYFFTFIIINNNCDPAPVSNPCAYSLLAMIILSPLVIIYTVIGGLIGEVILRKLKTHFG